MKHKAQRTKNLCPRAQAETKTVYMQLIDNNGIVITGNKNVSVSILDNQVICTDSSEFDYENIEMTHCFEWERVHMLATGYYLINLIIDVRPPSSNVFKSKSLFKEILLFCNQS